MPNSIRDYFEMNIGVPGAPTESTRAQRSLQLATAALLLEVIRSDGNVDVAEERAVLLAVRERFRLSDEESESLLRLAEQEVREGTGTYQFTSLINQYFDQSQKGQVMELILQAAYSDGELVAHEAHVVRRIADLLHVSHDDFIAAKIRARDAVADGWRTKD